MANSRFSIPLLAVYSLGVIAWTLGEFVTGGRYRGAFVVWGVVTGIIVGARIESRTDAEASAAGPALSGTMRVLSLASLYVLPLMCCDSVLLIARTYPYVWGVLAASYMLALQVGVLAYLWRRHLRMFVRGGT